MTAFDNPEDVRREFAELRRRIDQLETQALLEYASIDAGDGVAVRVPDGVHVEDGGSVKVGDLQVANDGGTGSAKAGTTELTKDGVGSGGAKIFSDGKIGRDDGGELATKGAFAVDGNLVVIGSVDGRGGVYTPWEGTKNTVEAIMGGIKTTAQNAASAASSAQGTANSAASAASTAQGRANDAWDYADAVDKVADAAKAQADVSAAKIGEIKSIYNAHIDQYHPGGSKIT